MLNLNRKIILQVTITLNFTPAEETEVAAILGCSIADLNNQLNTCAKASLSEYLTMFRGQKVFKRGSDMLEYRLLLLIENTFNGEIPDERTVSSLFQTTLTESRSLIKSVISKFQYQLRPHIDNTLKATLQRATRQNNTQDYTVVINSQNVVNELNKTLADIDGSLSAIIKKKGSVSTFEIPPSSYNQLCNKFHIQANP
jgi:hypothetical protein